jgi:glycosyltransferase involved in cell wall biosynthesis
MQKGAIIIFPWSDWDSHPTIQELGPQLARSMGQCLLVSPEGSFHLTRGEDGSVRTVAGRAPWWTPFRNPAILTRLLARILRWLALPSRWSIRRRYGAVVGVDPRGLVPAASLARAWGLPLAYASFEIMFHDELSDVHEERLKAAEVEASNDVGLVLIQDALRGGILCRENRIAPDKLVYVPVAPRPVEVGRHDLLREKLGIPAEEKILLLAGSMDAYCSRDLLESIADTLTDDFRLVVHARYQRAARLRLFLDQLARHPRISVSRDFLPMERLHELYASADYALLSYSPNPEGWTTYQNIYNIGAASGKAAYAAMCGLPLVTSDLPTYQQLFATYRCGAVYQTLNDIPKILATLEANYEEHARESRRYYEEVLDPRAGLEKFSSSLSAL